MSPAPDPPGHIGVFNLDTLAQVGDIPGVSAHGGSRRHRNRPRIRNLKARHHVRCEDLCDSEEDRRAGQPRRLPERRLQSPLLRAQPLRSQTSPFWTTRMARSSAPSTSAARPSRRPPTASGKIYVDIEDKAAIAVIDANTMKMVGQVRRLQQRRRLRGPGARREERYPLRRLPRQEEHDHPLG